MKCVRQGTTISRIDNDAAFHFVREGKATYVPKNVWKQTVRDAQ